MKLSCLFLLSFPSIFLCDPKIATPSPTTNLVLTPHSVDTSTTSTCVSFHLVQSEDTCLKIASEKGISISQFYAWNRGVGSECKELLPGNYVCVGVQDAGGTPEPLLIQKLIARGEGRGDATGSTSSSARPQPRTATRSYFGIRTDSKSLSSPTPSPIESGTVIGCQKFYSKKFPLLYQLMPHSDHAAI